MINRRQFLVIAASVAAATAGAYVAKPYVHRFFRPKLDTTYPLGVLREEEMQCIIALGETIVALQSEPPPAFFSDYVNAATQKQRGFLKEYQNAAALLNSTSTGLYGVKVARRFVDLSRAERDKVLQALLWQYRAYDSITRRMEEVFVSSEALAMRAYVMQPIIEHYYRSMYGWAVVGYVSFPSRPPLDPRAYTRSPFDRVATP